MAFDIESTSMVANPKQLLKCKNNNPTCPQYRIIEISELFSPLFQRPFIFSTTGNTFNQSSSANSYEGWNYGAPKTSPRIAPEILNQLRSFTFSHKSTMFHMASNIGYVMNGQDFITSLSEFKLQEKFHSKLQKIKC